MTGAKPDRIAVLLSGGLDSCVLMAEVAATTKKVYPVYIRQGLIWEPIERHWVNQFLNAVAIANVEPLREIDLPVMDVYDAHWSTTGQETPNHLSEDREVYLPGRNLLLLCKTALFCALNNIPVIALGPLSGNPFPDSTQQFFTNFEELAGMALAFPLSIQTPFLKLCKHEVIYRGRHLPLQLSYSCINPVGFAHCGTCNKCAERRRSFQLAGVEDKTRYHVLPRLS